jgi:GAF domain-containing protein
MYSVRMPYLRCAICGVLSYSPRDPAGATCPECGVPVAAVAETSIRSADSDRRLDALVRLTRDLLDGDVAMLTEVTDGLEIARRAAGNWPMVGSLEGASLPLEDTFCQRMLEGRIGNYVSDVQADARVNDLPMAQRLSVGAWIGTPIKLSGAQVYVLCCLAREARPSLGEREVRLIVGLAESVRAQLTARTSPTY